MYVWLRLAPSGFSAAPCTLHICARHTGVSVRCSTNACAAPSVRCRSSVYASLTVGRYVPACVTRPRRVCVEVDPIYSVLRLLLSHGGIASSLMLLLRISTVFGFVFGCGEGVGLRCLVESVLVNGVIDRLSGGKSLGGSIWMTVDRCRKTKSGT